jgi:hypothetical protein
VHADDLRAYARRPWHRLAALERDHWARELAARGPLDRGDLVSELERAVAAVRRPAPQPLA